MPRQRSPRGEGSIYYRKDRARWTLELDLTDRGGRRIRRSWTFATRAEAQRKRRALLAQRDAGQPQVNERQVLSAFLDRYESTVLVGRAGNTRRNVGTALHLIRPALGHLRLVALRTEHVETFYTQLQQAQYAPGTIGQIHSVLRRILAKAVEWGDLTRNPTASVRLPARRRVPAPFLDVADVQTLLAAVQGDPLEALVWLAVTTGMREGELIGLYWADLDLAAGVVRVQRQFTRDEGITPPKSARSTRVIPLAAPTRRILANRWLYYYQGNDNRRNDARKTGNPLVFPGPTGQPIQAAALRRDWWYPLLARAGLPRVTFHSLRRSCATFLLHLGMPLAQVSRILGHSSVSVTAAVYTMALDSGERAMMDRLGSLVDVPEGDKPSNKPSGEPVPSGEWRPDGHGDD